MQRPTCGIFWCAPVAKDVAEAVAADARAGVDDHALVRCATRGYRSRRGYRCAVVADACAVADDAVRRRCAPGRRSSRPSPITAYAPIADVAARCVAPRPITRRRVHARLRARVTRTAREAARASPRAACATTMRARDRRRRSSASSGRRARHRHAVRAKQRRIPRRARKLRSLAPARSSGATPRRDASPSPAQLAADQARNGRGGEEPWPLTAGSYALPASRSTRLRPLHSAGGCAAGARRPAASCRGARRAVAAAVGGRPRCESREHLVREVEILVGGDDRRWPGSDVEDHRVAVLGADARRCTLLICSMIGRDELGLARLHLLLRAPACAR